jgi:hypothetical protein
MAGGRERANDGHDAMLKGLLAVLVLLISATGISVTGAASANADSGCQVYWYADAATNTLVSGVKCSGTTPSSSPPSRQQTTGCINPFTGQTIPCTLNGAAWVAAWECYAQSLPNQPADPGHVGMTAYECRWAASGSTMRGVTPIYWARSTPAPVDPLVLAQEAVASMQLHAIRIGMVPEDVPGSMGIVGVPAWLWVDAPDAPTFGPATSSASAGCDCHGDGEGLPGRLEHG